MAACVEVRPTVRVELRFGKGQKLPIQPKVFGDGRTIDADKRSIGTAAPSVNFPRDEFLAGARFAENPGIHCNWGRRWRNARARAGRDDCESSLHRPSRCNFDSPNPFGGTCLSVHGSSGTELSLLM